MNNDPDGGPKRIGWQAPLADLDACKNLCGATKTCTAIDWFQDTKWCNLYSEACVTPSAQYAGSSSYQLAIGCTLPDDSNGILLNGHCKAGVQVPSTRSVIQREVPQLLTSPRSWALSLFVAIMYTYVMSSWCRERLKPLSTSILLPVLGAWKWLWSGGTVRTLIASLLVVAAWLSTTWVEWGPPPEKMEDWLTRPLTEWLWLAVSFVALIMALCKGFRSLVLSAIVSVGAWIMSAFTALTACALSACFDAGALGLVYAGGTASGEALLAADSLAAWEGVAAIEAGVGAEGVVAADASVAAGATAEASAAADAAVASEAAAAAEALAATDGAIALGVLCTVQ